MERSRFENSAPKLLRPCFALDASSATIYSLISPSLSLSLSPSLFPLLLSLLLFLSLLSLSPFTSRLCWSLLHERSKSKDSNLRFQYKTN